MEFYDYRTMYDVYRAEKFIPDDTDPDAFFDELGRNALQVAQSRDAETRMLGLSSLVRLDVERAWAKSSRPYYKLFPDTVDMMAETDLNVPCSFIHAPLSPILFRFAVERSVVPQIEAQGGALKTIMLSEQSDETRLGASGLTAERTFVFWIDFGETAVATGEPVLVFQLVDIVDEAAMFDEVLAQWMSKKRFSMNEGLAVDDDTIRKVVRIAVNACLLASSHSTIVEADVLNKHFDRYTRSKDENEREQLRKKAEKRGKRGWTIGREIRLPSTLSQAPTENVHEARGPLQYRQWQRGHWHTYRVGEGRTKTKIKWLMPVVVRPDLPVPPGRPGYKT